MKFSTDYFHLCFILMSVKFSFNAGQKERPRGVSLSNGPFYSDSQHFTCLDGSQTIPKIKVNDDFCDCRDGTDEPGTSACPVGQFHCNNRGFKPMYIPSSRVNDGICDCCDASDEFNSVEGFCRNTCKELGRADLEARNQQAVVQNKGFEIRKEYIKTSLDVKFERKESLVRLREELENMEGTKDEKERIKEQAELPEKAAVDKHKAAWAEEQAIQAAEAEKVDAEAAFTELDVNNDGIVDLQEIQLHTELDPDTATEFTSEEASNLLNERPAVIQIVFIDDVWKNLKEKFTSNREEPPETTTVEAVKEPAPIPTPVEEVEMVEDEIETPTNQENDYDDVAAFDDDEDYDNYADEDDDDDDDIDDNFDEDYDDEEDIKRFNEMKRKKEAGKISDDEDGMPEYDEDTKTLIAIADEARDNFEEVDGLMKQLQKNISSIENLMDVDLGPEEEFQHLQEQCIEYSDREYTYKLCLFDKTSQRPKSGGSETLLGKWDNWSGPDGDRYSEMIYTGGLKCWNGPDRSCVVKLKCGMENQLLSVSEPEKCVYEFTMTSPALCKTKVDLYSGNIDEHDEL